MSDDGRPRIVSVGEVGVHILGVIPRIPDTDRPIEMEEISIQVGGAAAIAAGTAAALGCHARLVCKLADDLSEQFIVRVMREAGIEIRGVVAHDRQLSPLSFSTIGREDRRKITAFTEGDSGELVRSDVDPSAVIAQASAVLIDGHSPGAQETVAERARTAQIPIIFDASEMREGVGTLTALADVIICSERLAAELAPRDSLEQTLVEIQSLGPRAVIITLGDAGAVGLVGDQMVQQAAFDVDIVDTDGAGSVFHGAFATAMIGGLPFAQCIEFASAAAAAACRRLGPWAGIPRRDEVIELVRSLA